MRKIRRREVFLTIATAGAAATLGNAASPAAAASSGSPQLNARRDKRRAQYQPNSPEIQAFYRVNRYPTK